MIETYVEDKMGRPTIDKKPAAILDYSFDWTDWLIGSDTISSHTVTVDASSGVTLQATNVTSGKIVTAWLAGGTVGKKARVTCHIVTTGGRTDERSIYLNLE